MNHWRKGGLSSSAGGILFFILFIDLYIVFLEGTLRIGCHIGRAPPSPTAKVPLQNLRSLNEAS